MEGQQTAYGYGGDAGNPFVFIHQSPYIDFTSGHMYPTEGWAGLNFTSARALLRRWIDDSHNLDGKPFFLGEWNAHSDKTTWWQQIYAEMEASGGDGDAFWWFPANTNCGGVDSGQGCPEHAVFRQHSAAMQAKSGIGPTTTSTTTRPPTSTTSTTTRPPTSTTTSRPPTTTTATTTTSPPGACTASYRQVNAWPNGSPPGFQGEITVRAGTAPVNGWTVRWTLASGQTITALWGGTLTTSGTAATVRSMSWNGTLPANGTATVGFNANGPVSTPVLTCTSP